MRVIKSGIAIFLIFLLSLSFFSCGDKKNEPESNQTSVSASKSQQTTTPMKKAPQQTTSTLGETKTQVAPQKPEPPKIDPEKVVAVIEMAKGGKIIFEFYPKEAPKAVDNFITLTNKGFYNGLKFHRVIEGFMAQGGDPIGDGTGGPGYTIKDEFNSHNHIKGTVAMARPPLPDSAGSQFYICFEPQPHLDGKYTVFGQVIEGMDIVDTIEKGDVMKKVSIVDRASIEKSQE